VWEFAIIFSAVQIAAWAILLRVVLKKLNKKEAPGERRDAREEKLFKLYSEIEGMLDSFEDYLREVHEEAERQRAERTEMSRQATVMSQALEYSRAEQAQISAQAAQAGGAQMVALPAAAQESPVNIVRPQKEAPSRLNQKERDELRRRGTKTQKVRFLMSRGFSLDEVAKELHIGKGEVRLITDLDKNA
jgi:hypothetical protein